MLFYTTPARPADPEEEERALDRFVSFCTRLGTVADDAGPEAEREEALALLRNPNLLLQFITDTELLGSVGQPSEKIVLKLAAASGRQRPRDRAS